MTSSYKFGGGDERRVYGALPEGDYEFRVVECGEPYQKDNGNWVLAARLSIQPDGETVFANTWSGTDKNGEDRDGIGDFLLAVNRAPAKGKEPVWSKVAGAHGKCRLKIEIAQQGALAGKEVNKVHYFYKPKEIGPGTEAKQSFTKEEMQRAQKRVHREVGGEENEPDTIPF